MLFTDKFISVFDEFLRNVIRNTDKINLVNSLFFLQKRFQVLAGRYLVQKYFCRGFSFDGILMRVEFSME